MLMCIDTSVVGLSGQEGADPTRRKSGSGNIRRGGSSKQVRKKRDRS